MRIGSLVSRSAIGVIALLLPFASAANAQESTDYVWQGVAIVSSATTQCSAATNGRTNIVRGTALTAIVRPAGLGANGSDARVSFILDSDGVFAADLASGLTVSGVATLTAYGVSTSGVPHAGLIGSYEHFVLTPASPLTTTPSLTLTGEIKNFMFRSGCTITFHAGYTARVG